MPPEALRVRIATCVRLQGWRVESSEVDATGRVALIARKDRARLVLRCAGTGTDAGTADDVQRLSAARREAGASAAALISPASPSHELRAAAAAANLQVLRFSELEHLDESLGLT
jgi:hypothetical protein